MTALSIRRLPLALPAFLGLLTAMPPPPAAAMDQTADRSTERAQERPRERPAERRERPYARPGAATVEASASLRDLRGAEVGSARLTQRAGGRVAVSVRVRGLTPGPHGLHVHNVGICDPNAVDPATGQRVPFGTAGGHYNPRAVAHGQHAGDMPLLFAGFDGRAETAFALDRFGVRELLDADGSAIVVHGAADNFAHIPPRYTHKPDTTGTAGPDEATRATGDSGDRVVCGVLRRVPGR